MHACISAICMPRIYTYVYIRTLEDIQRLPLFHYLTLNNALLYIYIHTYIYIYILTELKGVGRDTVWGTGARSEREKGNEFWIGSTIKSSVNGKWMPFEYTLTSTITRLFQYPWNNHENMGKHESTRYSETIRKRWKVWSKPCNCLRGELY